MLEITVNDITHQLDVEADTPLLWIPIRSCITPVSAVAGRSITTIEGISDEPNTLHVVQQAWIDEQVPQCGYCQSGQIMSAVALLEKTPNPTVEQWVSGHAEHS